MHEQNHAIRIFHDLKRSIKSSKPSVDFYSGPRGDVADIYVNPAMRLPEKTCRGICLSIQGLKCCCLQSVNSRRNSASDSSSESECPHKADGPPNDTSSILRWGNKVKKQGTLPSSMFYHSLRFLLYASLLVSKTKSELNLPYKSKEDLESRIEWQYFERFG